MKNTRFFRNMAVLLLGAILSGCAHKGAPTEADIERQGEALQGLARSRAVDIVEEPYLGARAVPISRDESSLGRHVTLRAKGTLAGLAAAIGDMTALAVHISDAEPEPLKASAPASGAGASGLELPDLLAVPSGAGPAKQLSINYEGPLRGLLDQLAAQSGYGWDYDEKAEAVVFARIMIRTYTLLAAPGAVDYNNTITNKSKENTNTGSIGNSGVNQSVSRGDSSTQTAQTNKLDLKYDIWADTEKAVKSLLSKQGTVVGNQAAGTLTVRDRPERIRQVTAFIRDINQRLSRQVALNVRVWSLEVNDDNEAGIDLQALFANKDVSVVAGSLATLGSLNTASATLLSGKLKDSAAVLKALKQWGNATELTSGAVVAMNNAPSPIEATKSHAYLAGSSISQSDYGQTAQVTPGDVTTGFSMTVIPHILDQRRVVLQYNIRLASLDDMLEYKTQDIMVQLPQVSTRAFSQRATMQMGQTLVLAGFQQVTQTRDNSAGLLSLGRKTGYGKSLLVITIELESVGTGMEARAAGTSWGKAA